MITQLFIHFVVLINWITYTFPSSINCHPTKTSVHIQINKGSQSEAGWSEKVSCLSKFVYEPLQKFIQQVERSTDFTELKDKMKCDLEMAIYNEQQHGIKGKGDNPNKANGKTINTQPEANVKQLTIEVKFWIKRLK